MYKNSCGFVCEDFPKENQTLQTRNDLCFSTKPRLFLYGDVHSYFIQYNNVELLYVSVCDFCQMSELLFFSFGFCEFHILLKFLFRRNN